MNLKNLVKCLAFSVVLLLSSCETDCTKVLKTDDIEINSPLVEVQKGINLIKQPSDIDAFISNYPKFWSYLMEPISGSNSQEVANYENGLKTQVYKMATDEKRNLLYEEVNKFFPNFDKPKTELDQLFKNVKSFYPDFKEPQVNTFISGFGGFTLEDGGDVLIVGLEYFMDSTAKYQPDTQLEMPGYIRKHYTRENIEVKAALALAGRYINYNRSDGRLINEMVKFGKILFFAKSVLPCRSEADILEYSTKELQGAIANDYKIYTYFTKNQLFYSTKQNPKRLFVNPRPNCVEIANECPGRIGQWLGYHIVKAYAQKNNLSLNEVMNETDHVKVFTQSGYKPAKK